MTVTKNVRWQDRCHHCCTLPLSQHGIEVTVAEDENAAVAIDTLPGKHALEVSANETLQFFQFDCIGCHLVLSVSSGSGWIKGFLLSEQRSRWCSGGSQALSDLFDPAHDCWN